MDSTPIAHEFGHRLDQLDREIHQGLAQVRRHLQELQAAEEKAGTPSALAGQGFAEVLRSTLDDSTAPESASRH